jgi:hypothetical protein
VIHGYVFLAQKGDCLTMQMHSREYRDSYLVGVQCKLSLSLSLTHTHKHTPSLTQHSQITPISLPVYATPRHPCHSNSNLDSTSGKQVGRPPLSSVTDRQTGKHAPDRQRITQRRRARVGACGGLWGGLWDEVQIRSDGMGWMR